MYNTYTSSKTCCKNNKIWLRNKHGAFPLVLVYTGLIQYTYNVQCTCSKTCSKNNKIWLCNKHGTFPLVLLYTLYRPYTYNVHVVKLAVNITSSDCAISMALFPLEPNPYSYTGAKERRMILSNTLFIVGKKVGFFCNVVDTTVPVLFSCTVYW